MIYGKMYSTQGFGLVVGDLDSPNLYNYLEIGCYDGVAISILAELFPSKTIYAIDPFTTSIESSQLKFGINESSRNNTYANIAGKNNIKLFEMTTAEVHEKYLDSLQEMNISHVFIDGSHEYDDILTDIYFAIDCIGNKIGIIAFDDIKLEPVKKAIKDFEKICASRIVTQDIRDSVMSFCIKNI